MSGSSQANYASRILMSDLREHIDSNDGIAFNRENNTILILVIACFVVLSLAGSTAAFTASTQLHSVRLLSPSTVVHRAIPSDLTDAGSQLSNRLSEVLSNGPYETFKNAGDALVALTSSLPRTTNLDDEAVRELSNLLATPSHIAAVAVFALSTWLLISLYSNHDPRDAPYKPGTNSYDPEAASDFYSRRPLIVMKRMIKLITLTTAFNTGLLFDWLVLGKLLRDEDYTALRKAEPRRAREALELCQQLGPTFIKLGQALSIRTDLIPEAYALELRQLQDAVPPFASEEAYDVLGRELGVKDLEEIFSSLSPAPVASASIGQVYRGKLASNGKDVAVKVQRPGILAEIALDLHVLRLLTPIQTTLQNAINRVQTTQEDIDTAVLLVDEWGRGFVAETDYHLEANNTITFERAMRERNLDAVCAPAVVSEYTRDNVLVTEWVEGTRLDRDASPDVPRLCGVAINAYLTMLLDTGVLHCDPHPGNLLRTSDGRLCILDWGMTLAVPNDLQYALLEFIAHINTEDYDAIPQDFINLGFSPPDVSADRLKQSGITDGLSFAFRQLSGGGGPKKIQERVKVEFQERYGNDLSDEELQKAARAEMLERMEAQLASEGVDVKGVTNVMEEMSRRNRELFALPPYVLYVARAFSTLEGIGLSIDEDYAIVQECYPYLARRLFTDRSPRAKIALKSMLGLSVVDDKHALSPSVAQTEAKGDAASSGALSPRKLIEMSEGFASYTAATADVDRDGAGQTAAAAEFAKLLLDPQGSALQDILVDEAARLGDAATRAALRATLVESPVAKAAAAALRAPKTIIERSRGISNIIPDPLKVQFVDRPAKFPQLVEDLVASNAEDERVLTSARELREALRANAREDRNGAVMRGAFANQISDGASAVPSVPDLSAVGSLVSTAEQRKLIADQFPGVAALGRRVGAGLLRRAAFRAERVPHLPEEARRALIDANEALADAIEPANKER